MSSSDDLFDRIRRVHRWSGLAVYAYEPGGPVTLEVLTPDGQTYAWTAPTLREAAARAFPDLMPGEEPAPAEAPAIDIFD